MSPRPPGFRRKATSSISSTEVVRAVRSTRRIRPHEPYRCSINDNADT